MCNSVQNEFLDVFGSEREIRGLDLADHQTLALCTVRLHIELTAECQMERCLP